MFTQPAATMGLPHLAVADAVDPIGDRQPGRSVGYRHHRELSAERCDTVADRLLRFMVERTRDLIEN